MDEATVREWFPRYMEAFVAEVRNPDAGLTGLLAHYATPLLFATDDGAMSLTTQDELRAVMGAQVDGMRAAGYSHTEVVRDEVRVANAATAFYECDLIRRDGDGAELARIGATYVIVDGEGGPRIHAVAVRFA